MAMQDVDRLHAIDRNRIKTLTLFEVSFKIHKEFCYQTGHNDEDTEWAHEIEDYKFKVSCTGGWSAINDVARYMKDSLFFAYDGGVTEIELVGIVKIESDVLSVNAETLKDLRNWMDEEKAKKRDKSVRVAQVAFDPITPEELAAL